MVVGCGVPVAVAVCGPSQPRERDAGARGLGRGKSKAPFLADRSQSALGSSERWGRVLDGPRVIVETLVYILSAN